MYTIIDVSNNNGGAIDFHKVKAAGIVGVLLKASEGTGFVDKTFASRRAAAVAAGLRIGAYHFGHPESDPVAQAHVFASVTGPLERRDFKPVLDFEQGAPSPSYANWIHAFNTTVLKTLGSYPIFYSYSSYITGLKLSLPVGNGLWLASFSRNDGIDHGSVVPAPWRQWNLHQFTSNGRVSGVSGNVDVSHAYTLNGLLAHPLLGRV